LSADLNTAIVAYLGYKRASYPQADWRAVVDAIGLERAQAIEIEMLVILSKLHEFEPDWRVHTLTTASELAVHELRKRHPEIGDRTGKALFWAYSYQQK